MNSIRRTSLKIISGHFAFGALSQNTIYHIIDICSAIYENADNKVVDCCWYAHMHGGA